MAWPDAFRQGGDHGTGAGRPDHRSGQRRGVASRYVYFPDEGHWIAQPQNRSVWWHEVVGWLDRYLKH